MAAKKAAHEGMRKMRAKAEPWKEMSGREKRAYLLGFAAGRQYGRAEFRFDITTLQHIIRDMAS